MAWIVATITTSCAPAYRIQRLHADSYPPSVDVAVIYDQPAKPYVILAEFRGAERGFCPASRPYCGLEAQAKALGAQAAWITRVEVLRRPEQWVEIRGRMTRIPESSYQRVEGLLLLFK